jgi:hypothetical protein
MTGSQPGHPPLPHSNATATAVKSGARLETRRIRVGRRSRALHRHSVGAPNQPRRVPRHGIRFPNRVIPALLSAHLGPRRFRAFVGFSSRVEVGMCHGRPPQVPSGSNPEFDVSYRCACGELGGADLGAAWLLERAGKPSSSLKKKETKRRWPAKHASGPPPKSRHGHEKGTALLGRFRWRDPDSNRGHHDFQSCGPAIWILLISREFRSFSQGLRSPRFPGLCVRLPGVTADGPVRMPFRCRRPALSLGHRGGDCSGAYQRVCRSNSWSLARSAASSCRPGRLVFAPGGSSCTTASSASCAP